MANYYPASWMSFAHDPYIALSRKGNRKKPCSKKIEVRTDEALVAVVLDGEGFRESLLVLS